MLHKSSPIIRETPKAKPRIPVSEDEFRRLLKRVQPGKVVKTGAWRPDLVFPSQFEMDRRFGASAVDCTQNRRPNGDRDQRVVKPSCSRMRLARSGHFLFFHNPLYKKFLVKQADLTRKSEYEAAAWTRFTIWGGVVLQNRNTRFGLSHP